MGKIFKDNFDVFFDDQMEGEEFHLYECGYEECSAAKPYEFKPLDYWVLHYCVNGHGYLEIHEKLDQVQTGDIFVIPPFTRNKYYPDMDDPWAYRWIGLRGTLVPKLLEKCNISHESYLIHHKRDHHLETLFENVYTASKNTQPLMAAGSVYHLLDYLQNNIRNTKLDQLTAGEYYFNEVKKYIHQNYFNDITITDIAKEINIDRTYIFKLFKKYLNISPSQYIQHFRLDKAAILLRKSSLSITDIGYGVGFNTPSHFSRLFSEYMGVTPSEYRKEFIITKP